MICQRWVESAYQTYHEQMGYFSTTNPQTPHLTLITLHPSLYLLKIYLSRILVPFLLTLMVGMKSRISFCWLFFKNIFNLITVTTDVKSDRDHKLQTTEQFSGQVHTHIGSSDTTMTPSAIISIIGSIVCLLTVFALSLIL